MELQSDFHCRVADESSRSDSPVEWWFVQGRYGSETLGMRAFMVSLFRHALEWGELSAGNAYTLLISVLDERTGESRWVSQVDTATIPFLVAALRAGPPAGLDAIAVQAVADEIEQYGVPGCFRPISPGAVLGSAPFSAEWGDFEFVAKESAFALRFNEPNTARVCSFQLTPVRPRLHLADVAVTNGGSMDYVSYARLELSGTVDGEQIAGEAWIDHQWGSQGWFVAGEQKEQILGWDWLGIQLENDCELLLMVIRDQRSGAALCRYGVLTQKCGAARLLRDVEIVPTSAWTSSFSGASYPIACHVRVRSLELELDFTPRALDQEIPVLAPIRALWEGAGRVNGTMGGKPVAGAARLELHGYAYLLDLERHLDRTVAQARADIEKFLPRELTACDLTRIAHDEIDPEAASAVIAKPLWDFMGRPCTKQWRPIFGMLMLGALGVDPTPYAPLISVTAELVHDGLLIVDDIEENSTFRRGEECLHLRYGIDVALNAGNTAFFLPFALLRDYPHLNDAQRLELYRILTRMFVRAHIGQGQDIYSSKSLTREQLHRWLEGKIEQRVLQMYTLKTAALVEAAAEGACAIAGADAETRRVCCDLARSLGIAYQIVNDIADFSPRATSRGDGSNDVVAGKLSYVIVKALRLLGESERARFETIFCSPELRSQPPLVAEAMELARRSCALAASRRDAHEMVQAQWKRFSERVPPSEAKTMLRVVWNFLLALGCDERHAGFTPGN